MNTIKQMKGITLIALVVTIIVLLILAGISITMLTGQNGILNRAGEAKEATGTAQEAELVQLAVTGALADGLGTITTGNLTTELDSNVGNGNYSLTEISTGWIVTIGENKYIIKQEGEITKKEEAIEGTLAYMYEKAIAEGCDNADGTCTDTNHLHIGDYVDLTNPTSVEEAVTVKSGDSGYTSDQVYTISTEKNQLNWRVLGENEAGEIELIAESPMERDDDKPYLYLSGAQAYISGETILNKICKLYKANDKTGYISSARSVNQDDVDKAVGITTLEQKKQYNLNTGLYGEPVSIGETYRFDNAYTPESWVNGKTSTTVSGIVNGYDYGIIEGNSSEESNYKNVENSRVFNMLFENTSYNDRYWLATKSVRACVSKTTDLGSGFAEKCAKFAKLNDSMIRSDLSLGMAPGATTHGAVFCLNMAYVGIDGAFAGAGNCYLFGSNGNERDNWGAVRPVVSLKSSVTSLQVPKMSDVT